MKVYVAGHTGLVGSAVCRYLTKSGHEPWYPTHQPDLRDAWSASDTLQVARDEGVEGIVLAAARVGGIGANSAEPVDFLLDNVRIATNMISGAWRAGIPRLVNLGSSCIYPRGIERPIREEDLLTGHLETTNEGYALAKIASLKLVQAYRRQHGCRYVSLMPCNLYGPGDRYDLERSHVVPSLIMKFERALKAREGVVLWGSGVPRREFLFVDDLARAVVWALEEYDDDLWLNVGSDDEVSVRELADIVGSAIGFQGTVIWDRSKPDGVDRKKLDWTRIRELGWRPSIPLREGVRIAIEDYRARNPRLL